MGDNPVICGKLSCPPPRIHIRCQSVIGCIHLHGQKRGMAEEKWGLSTSRTGIPLQRHKTVHLRHLTECFPKSLHEARPRSKATKKKEDKKKSLHPSICTKDADNPGFKKGSLQDGSTRFQTRWLFSCCQSGKFLPTSAEELRCRLTTRIFTFAPFIVPDRLTAADGATVKMPANAPTVRSSWFLSPKARSRYKQPLW